MATNDLNERAARAAERLREAGMAEGLTAEQVRSEMVEALSGFSNDELGELGIV
jgi:hypothetical protein